MYEGPNRKDKKKENGAFRLFDICLTIHRRDGGLVKILKNGARKPSRDFLRVRRGVFTIGICGSMLTSTFGRTTRTSMVGSMKQWVRSGVIFFPVT